MTDPTLEHDSILLEVGGVTKWYGAVNALKDVSLKLYVGEHAALVGDNGAGKSTLVKIITGAEEADAGKIWFDGQERHFRTPLQARLNGIETVYQDLALADDLGVVANIFMGREICYLRAGPFSLLHHRKMDMQARQMLAQTGVKIVNLSEPLRNMSGGQRQGVAIARAAGWGSKLILMDEPTAALGVQETQKVEDIISGLKRQGIAVLMISHNLQQVFSLADSIWVLRQGVMVGRRQVSETTPEEIISMITGAHPGPPISGFA